MPENQTKRKPQLVLVASKPGVDDLPMRALWPKTEATLSRSAAMPEALLALQLSLSASVADLKDLTNIIKSDIALTLQLLRIGAYSRGHSRDAASSIAEIVLEIGIDGVEMLLVQTKAATFKTLESRNKHERRRLRSMLTARIAEDLATRSSRINPETAYIAGLLNYGGGLLSMVHLANAGMKTTDQFPVSCQMADTGVLSPLLAAVIGGDRNACCPEELRALIDIVAAADHWTSRLESLALRDLEGVR